MDNGYAKVFSVRDEDIKVLNPQPQNASVSKEEEESKFPSSEAGIETQEKKPNETSQATSTEIDITNMKEEELYERINLFGTLAKVINYPRSSTMADLSSHNTYMVYDTV